MSGKNVTELVRADAAGIARAAQILESGGLVAVPTETVYGLAARADSAEAVARIYAAKGRPDFNPLIVHVPRCAPGGGICPSGSTKPVLPQGSTGPALSRWFCRRRTRPFFCRGCDRRPSRQSRWRAPSHPL